MARACVALARNGKIFRFFLSLWDRQIESFFKKSMHLEIFGQESSKKGSS